MADFRRQCSLLTLGVDSHNLAFDRPDNPYLHEGFGFPVLCEGCGETRVDFAGQCLDGLTAAGVRKDLELGCL